MNSPKVKTPADVTEKRLATMRRNLLALEAEAAAILSRGAENLTPADRIRLLQIVNVAYHTSGKIEGIYSVDSCAACAFCQAMIAAAQTRPLMICGSCYAAADAWKEAAWRRHKLNSMIFSKVLFPRDELASLAIGMLLRFNEDGDTVNIHVPVSDSARREAWDRMRPSRNLISPANRATMNKPEKEYIQGLYIATRMGKAVDGRARFFKSLQEAKEAYRQGIIDIDTPIQLPDNADK